MGDDIHLVHGMGMALEAPAWPAITMDEAAAILINFENTGALKALHWHSPRPFSAAAQLETSTGFYILKRHHLCLRDGDALDEEHGFIAHLHACGVAVPEIITACAPHSESRRSVVQGEWCYELHRQSLGSDLYRDRQSWTPYFSAEHAYAAGQALAKMHEASSRFEGRARGAHSLVSSFTIIPAANPLAEAEAYIMARPAIADYCADKPWRENLARIFERIGKDFSARVAAYPRLWTHNDWHPSNLLWSDHGDVQTIFDFGLSTQTCAIYDLATALERSCIPWLAMEEAPCDHVSARALLAGYHAILPLHPEDVDAVLDLLPFVHIEFALSEIDYFWGLLGDRKQADMAWYDFLIDHAEWFFSADGQAFIQTLRQASTGLEEGAICLS